MARIFSTNPASTPQLTLDALMQRQRDLARSMPTADRQMISPWQGAAYLGETLANTLQQRRTDQQLAEGRQALASVLGGIDYGQGPTGEQIGQAMIYDPQVGASLADLSASVQQRRLAREQELTDTQSQRIYEAGREARINQRELTEAEAARKAEEEAQIRKEERTRTKYGTPVTGEAAKAIGLDPTKAYQLNETTGQYEPIGGAGQTINVGGNEGSTAKKFGEKEGERFDAYIAAGNKAAGLRADMELLDVLGQTAPQGPVPGYLQRNFPGINSAGAAFNAVAKRLAPQMRVEGSGATSDIEYQGMVDSLPSLGNYPEANRLISGMVKAKSDLDIRRAEIATAWANDQIDLATARSQLNALNRQSIMTPELRTLIDRAAEASGMGVVGGGGGDFSSMTDEELDAEIARRRAAGER